MFMLIKQFKANPLLANEQGLNPLCLAAELGEEKLAEVSVGVIWFSAEPGHPLSFLNLGRVSFLRWTSLLVY